MGSNSDKSQCRNGFRTACVSGLPREVKNSLDKRIRARGQALAVQVF